MYPICQPHLSSTLDADSVPIGSFLSQPGLRMGGFSTTLPPSWASTIPLDGLVWLGGPVQTQGIVTRTVTCANAMMPAPVGWETVRFNGTVREPTTTTFVWVNGTLSAPVGGGMTVFSSGSAMVYTNTPNGAPSETTASSALLSNEGKGARVSRLTYPGTVEPLHSGREKIKARLRMLRRLSENHDNEGASAPDKRSVDIAIATVDEFEEPLLPCLATLDDDGSAVLEFEDRSSGFFADITFRADETVEFYERRRGEPSRLFEAPLHSSQAQSFFDSIGVMGQTHGGSARNGGVGG
jgi:hypothetical protein